MADALAVELHASGAETASDTGTALDITALRKLVKLQLSVTAKSSGNTDETLKVYVETSPTGGTDDWESLGTFAGINNASVNFFEELVFGTCERYVRLRWEIGGTTPSFTFSVAGLAHVLYVEPSDLRSTAIQSQALEGVDAAVILECCLRATGDGETAFNSSYVMPITEWGDDIRGNLADMAVYYAMKHRGFRPGGSDELIVKGHTDARSWLRSIANGKTSPISIKDSTADVYDAGAYVTSATKRGW